MFIRKERFDLKDSRDKRDFRQTRPHLLVALCIVALLAFACPSETTSDAPPSASEPSGVVDDGQTTPAPTSVAKPSSSPSLSGNGDGRSLQVRDRILGVHATYWDETSDGGLNVALTYKLWVGLSTDPANTEPLQFHYEVSGPDGYSQRFGETERFNGASRGNATPGTGGDPATTYSRLYFVPGPGLYTVSGALDAEEFSLDFEVVLPPNQLGAQAPPGTWERSEIPASDIAGLFDLSGLWAGRMPSEPGGYPHNNLSTLDVTFDAAYLEQEPQGRAINVTTGLRVHYTGTLSYADPYYMLVGKSLCLIDYRSYSLDGWLDYSPVSDAATFELKGWNATQSTDSEPVIVVTPIDSSGISSGMVLGRSAQLTEPIIGPVDELGLMINWLSFPDVERPAGCAPPFPALRPPDSPGHAPTGFVAYRASDLEGGPIIGRAIASATTNSSLTEATVALYVAGNEDGEPTDTTSLEEDGSFVFPDVPAYVRVDGELERAVYTLTVKFATGLALDGVTEVLFSPTTVAGVLTHSNHELRLDEEDQAAPITHFIAVGDRGVGSDDNPVVFHYSLEYWQCGGDFSPTFYTDGFTPAEIVSMCEALDPDFTPKKLGAVELLANMDGYEVWAGVDDVTGGGRSWIKQDVWIAEIKKTSNADALMPIYTGTAADVEGKWATIIDLAETYQWAEQDGFTTGNTFTQWPRSMYKSTQTNSNTFVHYLVDESGLIWLEMDGFHPGNDAPIQNTESDLGRPLTFYATNTPWVGTASKPEPSQPPP